MVSLRSSLALALNLNHAAVLGLLLLGTAPARGADLVEQWLQNQTNIQTWSATVTQTRSLRSLTQPLISQGQVWFSAPNLFRWEIGSPARTIALRQTNQMLVIYPALKRAERYPIDTQRTNPWKEALALLETGFPRSRHDLESRFRTLSQSITNDLLELTLEPRSASARKLMPELKIAFSTNDFILRATELVFTDGSLMRNEFSRPSINPQLAPDVFNPEIPPDYQIGEPLTRR